MARSADRLLERYRAMRDFASTPEPSGHRKRQPGRRFVVQKHAARALHYDFRIELDGVLKSWAVTKGPSAAPGDKRLAVQTEDHPVGYETFEGVIPEGYGAGTVMIWDRGTWMSQTDDPLADLETGQLKMRLSGQRMKGGWTLVLMKGRSSGARRNWLLIKERDEEADDDSDLIGEYTDSVVSGRSIEAIAGAGLDQRLPDYIPPQLASLADAPPSGDAWLHEIKYDGYRIQLRKGGADVELTTRNGKNWTARYPDIAAAARRLKAGSAVIDGELVAVDAEGRSDFGLLQNGGADERSLVFFAFDLLMLEGDDVRAEPLRKRKEKLRELLVDEGSVLRYSDHIEGDGGAIMERACQMRLEGVVSKKADAPYKSGRGRHWIKSKCLGRDEFVIGGYRKSDKKGRPFASLLLGEFEDCALRYRGRVGTGFGDETLDELARVMAPLEQKASPFAETPRDAKTGAVWLAPRLVAEIAYTERTASGALRHPSFLGLREDKNAKDLRAMKAIGGETPDLGGVRLTNPDRVLFEGQGLTKMDLAKYLSAIAEHILPFTEDRPVSLVRCPAGRSDDCFFQKHRGASVPEEIGEVMIEEKDGTKKSYLLVGDRPGLIATAQIGALELHGWGARADRIDRPDRLIIDLDPDEGMGFDLVKEAATEVRDVLASAGLRSFALLTGGKGVHVVAPLERRRGWNDVKAAARGLARQLAKAAPDRYVAEASKAKRRGRIFLDWLRNQRGATAIVPYSVRARPGAPVAVPVRWDELPRMERASAFSITSIGQRLSALHEDPWADFQETRQSITNGLLEALTDGPKDRS